MAYDANSIQVRDFRTAARTTPGMYIGADGQDAVFNCFLEILNNSCDEAIMGRGDKIEILVMPNEITISDAGAGVPRGPNKDCEEVLIELYTSAHSSGKFDTKNYSRVRGMHGVGASTVCVCSEQFTVWTRRDGAEWELTFIDGIPQAKTAKQVRKTKETGTTIYFKPDKNIFHIEENTPAFDIKRIAEELELTSYFIPNVSFKNSDTRFTPRLLPPTGDIIALSYPLYTLGNFAYSLSKVNFVLSSISSLIKIIKPGSKSWSVDTESS